MESSGLVTTEDHREGLQATIQRLNIVSVKLQFSSKQNSEQIYSAAKCLLMIKSLAEHKRERTRDGWSECAVAGIVMAARGMW